jgi:hypothetical protein
MPAALPTARSEAKASLLRVVARFGGAAALRAVRAALTDRDPAVRGAAVRALADWPDVSAAEPLLELVKTADDLTTRVLALRGYVNVIALDGQSAAGEILGRYEEALQLAPRPEDKKLVISAMASVRHPDVLKKLAEFRTDPALKAEAEAAIQKVEKAMKAPATATASHNASKAMNALDGKPKTRWDTGATMRGGEWFVVEMPMEQSLAGLTLDCRGSNGDYPRGYEVYVSRDGKNWGTPVASGKGAKPVVDIAFEPVFGRFIKIVQTGKTDGLYWSIHELTVKTR